MTEAQKIARAERKVQAMTGFYIHLATFVIVMFMLLALNFTDPVWWVQWPLIGWGLGVVAHYWLVFGNGAERLAKWQLKKIYELKSQM
jgi:hypothetical protein